LAFTDVLCVSETGAANTAAAKEKATHTGRTIKLERLG